MFETSTQYLWIENNREKVNAVNLFEVKQNGYRRPKYLPCFPFLIGKAAD